MLLFCFNKQMNKNKVFWTKNMFKSQAEIMLNQASPDME